MATNNATDPLAPTIAACRREQLRCAALYPDPGARLEKREEMIMREDTHGVTPQTAARNVKILREWAEFWGGPTVGPALLAGAAAIEAVEVAKGALRHACPELVIIQDEQGGCVWCGAFGRTQSRSPQDKDHMRDCAWLEAREALARLEAL